MGRDRRFLALVGALALMLSLTAPTVTRARMIDADTTTQTVTTDTLNPPTSLAATGGSTAALTWTPTVDTYASGYQVLRSTTSGSGYAQVGTATPRSASSFNDTPSVDGTYFYVLRSYIQNWTSAQTAEVSASVKMGVTGFKACTSQAADSGGDNNGYELNPASGCADDAAVASDANSGTGTGTTCSATGKDRHRFQNFGLGLPGVVNSITGITVKTKSAISAVTGTNILCAQLSWDGGTNWTATQQVNITSASLTYYTFGGTTFLWGRAWAVGNLSDANLRVRLIDVANSTARTFTIDTVQVQVKYVP
jgi:hypothetical protein